MKAILEYNEGWPIKDVDNRAIDTFSEKNFFAQLKEPEYVVTVGKSAPTQKIVFEDNPIGIARKAIAELETIPKKLQEFGIETGEDLARRFSYSLAISTSSEKCEPGASKIGGLPHLGKGMRWPKDHYFYAQFNLAELKQFDIANKLPPQGILYHFITSEGFGKILFYSGSQEDLKERNYPKEFEVASYFKESAENEKRMKFTPGYFFMGEDTYMGRHIDAKSMDKIVSKALKQNVKLIKRSDGDRLWGEPQNWQGEIDILKGKELFSQLNYAEGVILSGIKYDNLKKGKLGNSIGTYSGT